MLKLTIYINTHCLNLAVMLNTQYVVSITRGLSIKTKDMNTVKSWESWIITGMVVFCQKKRKSIRVTQAETFTDEVT